MKTSIVNCSITESEATNEYGAVLNMHDWFSSESDRTIANAVIVNNGASGIYGQIAGYGSGPTSARWRIINTTIGQNLNGGGDNGYGIEAFTGTNDMLNGKNCLNIAQSPKGWWS